MPKILQIIINAGNMTLEVENIPIGETMSFESSALNGLRGFAAVHILIYHSVLYSSWGFQIYGQVSLIFFFPLTTVLFIILSPSKKLCRSKLKLRKKKSNFIR